MKKCRSCKIIKDECMEVTKHTLVEANFVCAVCNKIPKWYSHMNDDLVGDALECKSCHNYILYVIPDIVPGTNDLFLEPWKDEIYLLKDSKEILVMRNFEDNNTYVAIDNKRVTDFNGVLQFNSVEYLFKKLESIIVFS